MLIPLEIFGEILKYVPYHEQGSIRKTCSILSKLIVKEKHACLVPQISEVVSYLFLHAKALFSIRLIKDNLSFHIVVEDKSKHAFYSNSSGIVLTITSSGGFGPSMIYGNKHFITQKELRYFLSGFSVPNTKSSFNSVKIIRQYCQMCCS